MCCFDVWLSSNGLKYWITIWILQHLCTYVFTWDNVVAGRGSYTTQSSTHYDPSTGTNTADNALDGNRDGNPLHGSCIDTFNGSGQAAWWQVDMGRQYDVYSVTIYNPIGHTIADNDTTAGRLADTWILVSDYADGPLQPYGMYICAEITYNESYEYEVIQQCTYDPTRVFVRGRYLRIQRKNNATMDRHILHICEVEVSSCNRNTWGVGDCQKTCDNCKNQNCHVLNGVCYEGCETGFWGSRCNNTCNMNCNNQICHIVNGYCAQGCKTGFWGSICNQTCYCIDNEPCDTDGNCTACAAGYGGIHCSMENINNNDSNTDAIIGGVVTAIIVIIALVVLAVLYFKYKQKCLSKKTDKASVDDTVTIKTPGYANAALEEYDASSPKIPEDVEINDSDSFTTDLQSNPSEKLADDTDVYSTIEEGDIGDKGYIQLDPAGKTRASTAYQVIHGDEDEYYMDNLRPPPVKVKDLLTYLQKLKTDPSICEKEFQSLPTAAHGTYMVGKDQENKRKNRFGNVIAYDRSRVRLNEDAAVDGLSYINASFIPGYKDKPQHYVAAQGPLEDTIIDTWNMIWQLHSNRVVMVTRLEENDKILCEQYWPEISEQYGQYNIELIGTQHYADYEIKQLTMAYKEEKRTIYHFQFTNWPEIELPVSATSLIEFRKKIHTYDNIATGPMVVHSSAGVGRTATFIAIDYLLEQAKVEDQVDVYGYTYIMRSRRFNMIQYAYQYMFVYKALFEALMSAGTTILTSQLKEEISRLTTPDTLTGYTPLADQFEILQVINNLKRKRISAGFKPTNKNKNRFPDIVPRDDRCRPYLSLKIQGYPSDYINAVYIDGYQYKSAYIQTQMPLKHTVADIWRLVYDHEVRTIVMLDPLPEEFDKNSRDSRTICPYWPEKSDSPLVFGTLTINLEDEHVLNENIVVREFTIKLKRQPCVERIKQFHVTNWIKDTQLPSQKVIFEVMDLVEERQQKDLEPVNGPIIVQCINGAHKSGLYCAAAYIVERLRLEQEVDVFHAVKHVRIPRPQNIANVEQYMYLYELALEFTEKNMNTCGEKIETCKS